MGRIILIEGGRQDAPPGDGPHDPPPALPGFQAAGA